MIPTKNGAPRPATPSKIEHDRFSARLLAALKGAGLPTSPTKLAARFNEIFPGAGVNAQSVRKWLLGQSIPTQDKLRTLAGMLGTTSEWLRFGADPGPSAQTILADIEALDPPLQSVAHQMIRILLSYKRGLPPAEAANG